jgi:signal peptidase I
MKRFVTYFILAVLLVGSTTSCGVASTIIGVRSYTIPSSSMEPTVKAGSRVRARLTDGDYNPRSGDIVIFRRPKSWGHENPDAVHVGRVIGIPQNRVACCDAAGHLTIDGKSLDEPYITANPASAVSFDATVPKDRLWIMGDNRDISLDSRAYLGNSEGGTIGVSDIVGVVFSISSS